MTCSAWLMYLSVLDNFAGMSYLAGVRATSYSTYQLECSCMQLYHLQCFTNGKRTW